MVNGAGSRSSSASPIQVSDLDLASYLVAEGARLVGIAATVDPARRVFVLQGSAELIATAMQRFRAGDALVEPRSYAYARRFLRRALDRPSVAQASGASDPCDRDGGLPSPFTEPAESVAP